MANPYPEYDSYGKLKSIPWPDIKKGDLVSYTEPKRIKSGNKTVKAVVKLVGIWDGEKVQFDDEERTLVRTIRWLTKEN